MTRTLDWNELNHDHRIGYGQDGLVLKLDHNTCIKIYSPDRAHVCPIEKTNLDDLFDAGLRVPRAHERVRVHLAGREVKLPGRCEFAGIGLHAVKGIESVPALIREYIPGSAYGTIPATIKQANGLLRYLREIHAAGFALPDSNVTNFIITSTGPVLIDVTHLVTPAQVAGSFSDECHRYDDRIFGDWKNELRARHLLSGTFDFKVSLAKLLTR